MFINPFIYYIIFQSVFINMITPSKISDPIEAVISLNTP